MMHFRRRVCRKSYFLRAPSRLAVWKAVQDIISSWVCSRPGFRCWSRRAPSGLPAEARWTCSLHLGTVLNYHVYIVRWLCDGSCTATDLRCETSEYRLSLISVPSAWSCSAMSLSSVNWSLMLFSRIDFGTHTFLASHFGDLLYPAEEL